MLIGMNQLAGLDDTPKNFNRLTPANRPRMRMPDAKTSCERLETAMLHFIVISNGAIGDGAHAPQ